MNRRQKIIVSITGIFIVLLALVGLTYAYFLTKITGNENPKSISVTTANLELRYDDASENIILDGAMPNTTRTKSFTVTNNGNAKVEDYQVYLENVINELERKDDLVYTLTCTTSDATNSPCTNEITSETTFPSTNGTILTNSLDTNDVHTYTLTLTYKEMNVDQSIDMNKKINAKINIYDKNDINTLTLGHYILSNGALVEKAEIKHILDPQCVKVMGEQFCIDNEAYIDTSVLSGKIENDKTYTEKTQITKVSDGTDMTDVGIFTAPDDYGTSFYYRGTVKNNYVDFAGFTWRIVRINGDGSIRLILDGRLDETCVEYNPDNTCKTYAGESSVYNPEVRDPMTDIPQGYNAYIGYKYGIILNDTENVNQNRCLKLNGISVTDYINDYKTKKECEESGGKWTTNSYEATHVNVKDSIIKQKVDEFYERYIENSEKNIHYEKFIADTLFCNDKSLAKKEYSSNNTALGFGTQITYYAAVERLNFESITTANPTLKCAEGENNTYSRFTVKEQNINNLKTNGDLKYPIALLTADETILAGAWGPTDNIAYYLYDGSSMADWWTNTPVKVWGVESTVFSSNKTIHESQYDESYGIRPVINLKSNVLIESGDGTSGSGAYKVRLAND